MQDEGFKRALEQVEKERRDMKAARLRLSKGWQSLSRLECEAEALMLDKLCVSPTGFLAYYGCENDVYIRTPQGKLVDARCLAGGLPRGANLSFTKVVVLQFLPSGELVVADADGGGGEDDELHGSMRVYVLAPDSGHKEWAIRVSYPLQLEPFVDSGGGAAALSIGESGDLASLAVTIFVPPGDDPSQECRVVTYNMLGTKLKEHAVCWSAGRLDEYLGWGERSAATATPLCPVLVFAVR